jgi:hypothetical protein
MAEDTDPLGNESTDQTMKAFATVKARFKTDIDSLTGLSREFGTLKDSLRSINDELTKMIALGAQTATTLQGVAQAGGGVGGSAIPGPATGTGGRSKAGGTGGIAVASSSGMWQKFTGNLRTAQTNLHKPASTGGFVLNQAVQAITQSMQWTQSRVKGAAPYMLSSDRMGNLVRQMYGGSQLSYQANFREPLTDYLIGSEGITPLLGLQVSTGLNAKQMAKGVEGIRVASGFGYSTQDATQMIRAMAQPGSSNMMTMMLGMGLYGPGGKSRDPMDVVRNTVSRLGLTNEAMVAGALQPGSMTRANLARTGLPMDMQDLVIQYAQENIQYRKKGGTGMYDPSESEHRSLMGVEEGYATEFERTRQSEMGRQENFYRRQIDNYEQLEENTQRLIEVFGKLEDKLSRIIGGQISMTNKWWRGALPLAGAVGGGALGLLGGNPGTVFLGATAGYSLGKGAAGALGDPEPVATTDFSAYGLATSLVGAGTSGSMGIQALANKAALPISEGGIATQLTLTSGVRTKQEQWNLFADAASGGGSDGRHTVVSAGQEQPGDRFYGGKYYRMNANGRKRGYAAPPDASKHQTGKAADLGPNSAHPFIAQNASRFGLKTAPNEDWHVTLTADARNTAVDTVLGQSRNAPASSTAQYVPPGSAGPLSLTKLQRRHGKYTPVEYSPVTQPVSSGSLASAGDPHYASSSISQWGPGPWNSTLGGGSSPVITISPTLNLSGSGNGAVDAQRLADQVIKLIETSRVVQSLRRS